jgi:hypothetical protein
MSVKNFFSPIRSKYLQTLITREIKARVWGNRLVNTSTSYSFWHHTIWLSNPMEFLSIKLTYFGKCNFIQLTNDETQNSFSMKVFKRQLPIRQTENNKNRKLLPFSGQVTKWSRWCYQRQEARPSHVDWNQEEGAEEGVTFWLDEEQWRHVATILNTTRSTIY